MFFIVYNVHFYPLFYYCIKAIYYNYYNNNILYIKYNKIKLPIQKVLTDIYIYIYIFVELYAILATLYNNPKKISVSISLIKVIFYRINR